MKKIILIFIILYTNVYAIDIPSKHNAHSTRITGLSCAPIEPLQEIGLAVKWYRDSAEKNALYQQAFSMGDVYIQNKTQAIDAQPHTWGVILDIDETVLDNSWYSKTCDSFPSNANDFSQYIVLQQKSQATPGAKKFTCGVQNSGGYVSLVSNRDGSYPEVLEATLKNLKAQGICFDQVIISNPKSREKDPFDKNLRFNAVQTGTCNKSQMVCSNKLPAHAVIAYFGDNIQDFPKLKQDIMIKRSPEDAIYTNFSSGFFILPNPLYGSWKNNQFN